MSTATWFLLALYECQCCGHRHIAMWRDPAGLDEDRGSDCSVCGRLAKPVEIEPEVLGAMMGNSTYTEEGSAP